MHDTWTDSFVGHYPYYRSPLVKAARRVSNHHRFLHSLDADAYCPYQRSNEWNYTQDLTQASQLRHPRLPHQTIRTCEVDHWSPAGRGSGRTSASATISVSYIYIIRL